MSYKEISPIALEIANKIEIASFESLDGSIKWTPERVALYKERHEKELGLWLPIIQEGMEEYAASLCEACKAPCEWERTDECAADHVLYKTSCGHKLIRQKDDVCPQCGHKIIVVLKGENK